MAGAFTLAFVGFTIIITVTLVGDIRYVRYVRYVRDRFIRTVEIERRTRTSLVLFLVSISCTCDSTDAFHVYYHTVVLISHI
jgi:hypothetical protein